ncbi:hypothetical protein [Cupriavidus basilensis]|uniref:hypothetical protein n=1 Tax=Cupriavidus basilensis TaxID=68895 RepID=UPI0020A67F64|nr:hypothetical protein [Cupriavidus basilensis]MCP3022719.1 hypothetical protein [Cupriavidus basilensis]
MEHLVRVQNEYDRQVLAWLRERVGDAAVQAAAQRLAGDRKPYLSTICRSLNITPPARRTLRAQSNRASREVGDRYLASIRALLARPAPAQRHSPQQPAQPQPSQYQDPH